MNAVAMPLLVLVGLMASPREELESEIQQEIDAGRFPGAVVAVGTRAGPRFLVVKGDAQVRPARVAMRADSIFDMASVTKAVATATAIGILVDDGKLTWDHTLRDLLPDHKAEGAERILLRHLGAHVSGFREAPRVYRGGTGDAFFASVLNQQPTWKPGERFEYACKNCITLSTAVERVSGMTFEAFCRTRIFDPLEMRETRFHRVPASDRVAGTYVELGLDHNEDGQAAGRGIGNAGLFSTAGDLERFCQMMLGKGERAGVRILSEATWRELVTSRFEVSPHAFLWQTGRSLAHRPEGLSDQAFGHSGYTGQSIWIDPAQDLYLIILTNRVHPERVETNSPLGKEQIRARARIGTAAIRALKGE